MLKQRYIAMGIILACTSAMAEPLRLDVRPSPLTLREEIEQELRSIPGGVSVTSDDQWNASRGLTVKDMLDYTPGIIAQPRNGAESSRLSIRGSGLAEQFQGRGLLLLQDGVPLNYPDGSFDFHEIAPWQIDLVTVYRGANGFSQGAATLGGAIDFITPTGQTQQGSLIRGEFGSFGTQHLQLSHGQQSGDSDVYASAIYLGQNGFRGQNDKAARRFSGNVGHQFNDALSTRFYLYHTSDHAEIPGTLSKAEIIADPEQAKPINAARHYARFVDSTRVANRTEWTQGDLTLRSTLYARDRSLENPVFTYISNDSQDVGWRGYAEQQLGAHRLQAGMNLAYGRGKELRYENDAGKPGDFLLERREQAASYTAWAQYDHAIRSDITGIVGLQANHATRRIDQRAPTATVFEAEYTGLSPRLGVLYDINPSHQLFANISRSFEPPTTGNLSGGNDPGARKLDAQTATSYEIGSRGDWQGWQYDIALYHAELENELLAFQFPDGTSDTVNAGDTTHSGIELAVNGDLLHDLWQTKDALHLNTSYVYQRFRLHDDAVFGDKTLPGVPEQYLRAQLLYRHPSGLQLGPDVEWVPDAPVVDLANSLTAQSYILLGAQLAYAPEDTAYQWHVRASNLLDKTYIATFDVQPDAAGSDLRAFYPGEGRAIYAGFSYSF